LDVLTSVLFYALAALALIGALGVAVLPAGSPRALSFLLLAAGAAGMYAVLEAGFVAALALVVLVASGLLLAPRPAAGAGEARAGTGQQVAALAAAGLFALLAYAAYRGGLFKGTYAAADFGFFNAAAMGQLLLGRDALATEASGALLMLGLVAGAASWAGWAVRSRRSR
jgi:hypothetical protein